MTATTLPVFPAFAISWAVLLLLKATIVLSLAGLVASRLRGRPAAARHLVWLTALLGTLALVPLATVAPRLPLRLPEAAGRALPRLVLAEPAHESGVQSLPGADPSLPATHAAEGRWEPTTHRSGLAPGTVMTLIWLAGSLAVGLWSAFGHLGLWGLLRSSIPVARETWARHYGLEPRKAGGAGRIRLALSSVVGTPLTWGFLRPVVLLPSRSSAWPLERRRAALLHELAHVDRADYVAQLISTLACAVYWFHPLAWWAAARLRSESEHACDDRVLAAGMPAPAYATDLLAVAHGARGPGGSSLVAIGMARRTHLEGRLLAVLDESRPRGAVRPRAGIATVAATLLLLIPLAGLEPRLLAATASAVAPTRTVTTVTTASTSTTTRTDAAKRENATPSSSRKGSAEASEHHQMENTMPAKPGGRLELDLKTGGSVEIRSWDRSEVYVRAELAGGDWRDTQLAIGPESFGVAVRALQVGHSSMYTTSHHFDIRVPRRYDVHLSSAGGGLTIVGVDGTFEGTTGGGELVLENASGRASLSTGGGDIDVSDCDLRGSVTTGGGTVKLSRVKGGLRGSSGSGPVIYSDGGAGGAEGGTGDLTNVLVDGGDGRIKVGTKAAGFLHIERAGGTVDLDDVPQGAEIRTGGGGIFIRKGSGSIEARTGGGDIAIGPVAGSVLASTGAGEVRIRLASIGGREQNVQVWSGTGTVVVELPADLNARFEIETAYTESHGHPSRITSAWPLELEPVTDWDTSHGTARRYVRATGTAGRGEGLIHIETVNGDIELRRAGAGTTSR